MVFMMQYKKLNNTGLDVSRICLGCMDLGEKDLYPWHLDEAQGIDYIKYALDQGINFFDTANVYSHGNSEIILGKAIKKYAKRENVVIATKVFYPVDDKANLLNNRGLSRKHIMQSVEASLKRLQMDYIDLLIIHRWDYQTPIEETMCALNDLIKNGKVHYIGASAMYAWQFQKAQYIAKSHHWTPFISMQNHYNLIYREDEREMIPLCQNLNIALTPYSPLAGGILTRDWYGNSKRALFDHTVKDKYEHNEETDHKIVHRVGEIAKRKGVSRAMIALAWLFHKEMVCAPLIGGSKTKYIDEAIQALDITLTPDEIHYLEEMYTPHRIVGAL